MISIVSEGRDRPLEDKKGLALRDTNTKRRKEFNVALCDTDWSFINEAEDSLRLIYRKIRRNRLHLFPFNKVKRKRLTKNYKAFDL